MHIYLYVNVIWSMVSLAIGFSSATDRTVFISLVMLIFMVMVLLQNRRLKVRDSYQLHFNLSPQQIK